MTQGPFGLFFLLTVPALVRCRLDANGKVFLHLKIYGLDNFEG